MRRPNQYLIRAVHNPVAQQSGRAQGLIAGTTGCGQVGSGRRRRSGSAFQNSLLTTITVSFVFWHRNAAIVHCGRAAATQPPIRRAIAACSSRTITPICGPARRVTTRRQAAPDSPVAGGLSQWWPGWCALRAAAARGGSGKRPRNASYSRRVLCATCCYGSAACDAAWPQGLRLERAPANAAVQARQGAGRGVGACEEIRRLSVATRRCGLRAWSLGSADCPLAAEDMVAIRARVAPRPVHQAHTPPITRSSPNGS
jgi:hypothetical protein